ncbi:MAG: hypothetical protein IJV82_01015 [Oscillospiraceae bacterium]|nr:hypothetical protein [Oscillospiraceae bacterium]
MVLEIDDWKFDIDMAATMEYSAAEAADHCTCAYCRNFYAAVDNTYPNLRTFLAQFGIDIEAPDELMPFTSIMLMNLYAVSGSILQFSKEPILVDGIKVFPETAEQAMINTYCPRPYFVLSVGTMDLPWVLDEPMEEDQIISPANVPSFLKKMWSKLLNRQPKDDMKS